MGTKETNNSKNNMSLNAGGKNSTKRGLIVKLLSVIAIPILLIIAISGFSLRSIAVNVSNALSKHELHTATYALTSILDTLNNGSYEYRDGSLYKGSVNVSNIPDAFDDFVESTELDATVIVGKTRVVTTIINEEGKRAVGTDISDKVYEAVLKDGSYFTNDIQIQGTNYEGYYELVPCIWMSFVK